MGTKNKAASARSVRRSVTIPASLAADARLIAKEPHLTMSLAERGVCAEADAKQGLTAAYRAFVDAAESERKSESGRDLIRAVFGKNSIAEDFVY